MTNNRDIREKLSIHNLRESPDTRKTSDRDISGIRISDQFLIIKNCHNAITSNNIDIKLGPAIKLDKENTTTSKNKLIMTSCQQIVNPLSFF